MTTQTIHFNVRVELPTDRQEALLEEVRRWPGVSGAGRVKPDARRAEVRRMAYAHVDEHVADAVLKRLAGRPDVESASLPAPRKLV